MPGYDPDGFPWDYEHADRKHLIQRRRRVRLWRWFLVSLVILAILVGLLLLADLLGVRG